MNNSYFSQISSDLLVEYIYTDVSTPESHKVSDYRVEVLKNSSTKINYFLNNPNNISDTQNVRDNSVGLLTSNSFVLLNRNIALQYIDFDNNFTPSSNLEPSLHPDYEIKYDTIKIHISNIFSTPNGNIFDIFIQRRDGSKINLSSLYFDASNDMVTLNPKPLIVGEKLYNKYILLKIPSLYFLLQENPTDDNITYYLSNQIGYVSSTRIYMNLYEISKTETKNSFTYFTANSFNLISFNYKDDFDLLSAHVSESTEGDYYELYGVYNNQIYENFINELNSITNNDYVVFHEITVTEQVGTEFIETGRQINLQTDNFGKPYKFRPIVEYSSNASSYSLDYVMRVFNRYDNTQIIKESRIVSFDTKKYGRNLKKINVPVVPVINKIYNKIENTSYTQSTGTFKERNIISNIVSTEYINVFRDRVNVVISSDKISIDNFKNNLTALNTFSQGKAIIGISPFDDFILFNFYTLENSVLTPLDLTLYGSTFLNFFDKDVIQIQEYQVSLPLERYQKVFAITKDIGRKILQQSTTNFYITAMSTNSNNTSNENLVYVGNWLPYEKFIKI